MRAGNLLNFFLLTPIVSRSNGLEMLPSPASNIEMKTNQCALPWLVNTAPEMCPAPPSFFLDSANITKETQETEETTTLFGWITQKIVRFGEASLLIGGSLITAGTISVSVEKIFLDSPALIWGAVSTAAFIREAYTESTSQVLKEQAAATAIIFLATVTIAHVYGLEIGKKPLKTIVSTATEDTNNPCNICLSVIVVGEEFFSHIPNPEKPEIKHTFHLLCIKEWEKHLKKSSNPTTCPTCREEITIK